MKLVHPMAGGVTLPSRPWRRGSTFDEGRRHPLNRDERRRWRSAVAAAFSGDRFKHGIEAFADILLGTLGPDGQLDPTLETLAGQLRHSVRTVQRMLDRLLERGLIEWDNRVKMARVDGRLRPQQTSNAYELIVPESDELPAPRPRLARVKMRLRRLCRCARAARDGLFVHGIGSEADSLNCQSVGQQPPAPELTPEEPAAARAALARRVAEKEARARVEAERKRAQLVEQRQRWLAGLVPIPRRSG